MAYMKSRAFGAVLTVTAATASLTACQGSAGAMSRPIRAEVAPSSHIGWEADRTTGGNVCTAASHDKCQSLKQTSEAGGFDYPDSVAIDPVTGDMYVAEVYNNRVQELTAAGTFVSMFGWDVNKTDSELAGRSQAEKNVCTAASKDICGAGASGSAAGQLDAPESVTVDPSSGDVYVAEIAPDDLRVDKYTRDGRFVWRIGKGVNRKTKGNLCTAREIERARARCGPAAQNAPSSAEHGAFKFANQSGDLLAFGGPEHLLYVGDEHRVQAFAADGSWKREIPLASLSAEPHSSVVALALGQSGHLYLVYRVGPVETYQPNERANIVHEFDQSGEQVAEYPMGARYPGSVESINGLAVDRYGQLAAIGVEVGPVPSGRFGLLLSSATGTLISEFTPPVDDDGLAANGQGDLYFATAVDQEVAVYAPALARELVLEPLPCEASSSGDGSAPAPGCTNTENSMIQ
jgi:hypothetical protein